MATKPLGDDETRLAPYDKLSRGKKQEIDLARRAALKAAKEQEEMPVGNKVANAYFNINPLVPKRVRDDENTSYTSQAAARKARVKSAQDEADYKDVSPRKLFGDDVVHKLADADMPAFKKGGSVKASRGDGIAKRGHTRGKFV